MSTAMTRRSLFKAFAGKSAEPSVRPPWSLPETQFIDICSRCDACVDACGEGIICRGDGGYPTVDFQNGACTFCGDCATACKDDAIVRAADDASPWTAKARIAATCLSERGVSCRVCGDACDVRAIRFQLAVGGRAVASISTEACNGCGACVQPCPVGAVTVT